MTDVKEKVMIVVTAVALGFLGGCGKKQAPESQSPIPEARPLPQVAEEVPFVLPLPAKKQAKYFPEGTPSRAIQDLDDTLDSYIVNPTTPDEEQYNERLKRHIINGTFDIRELCRLALDKHWGERKVNEQDYFVDLMSRLLEKKAIFSKEQGQKKQKKKGDKVLYKVTYEGDRYLNPEKSQGLARSTVHIPSEALKIGLNYKLKKIDGAWKIYDVVVDDASLLDNYKYQFDRIIDKDGYSTLIHRMESKLKELEEKGEETS